MPVCRPLQMHGGACKVLHVQLWKRSCEWGQCLTAEVKFKTQVAPEEQLRKYRLPLFVNKTMRMCIVTKPSRNPGRKQEKNYIGESLNYFTCIDMIQDVSMHHLPTCLPFTPLSRLTIEGSRFQAMQFLSLCTV